jgi:hypothetical protein
MTDKKFNKAMKIYATVRRITSPLLYLLYRTINNKKLPDKWSEIKQLEEKRFKDAILSYEYRRDFLWGLVDMSLQQPNFFFDRERDNNRDCDDFAHMWYWWAIGRGYPAWVAFIIENQDISTAHVITVFHDGKEYVLADYHTYRNEYSSVEEAILGASKEKLNWVIYKRGQCNG